MRCLKKNFIKELNILEPILEYVRDKKNNVYLGIRENQIHIYYRGGVLVKIHITNRDSYIFCAEFDYQYAKTEDDCNKIEEKCNNLKKDGIDCIIKTSKKTVNSKILFVFIKDSKEAEKLRELFEILTKVMDNYFDNDIANSRKLERQAQHILSVNSKYYYCVDIEYTQSSTELKIKNVEGKAFGKYDMIMISKDIKDGKHKIILVELKYGNQAYSSNPTETIIKDDGKKVKESLCNKILNKVKDNKNYIDDYEGSCGSGIVGHFADFYRFIHKGNYKYLKQDILGILKAKNILGLIDFNDNHLKKMKDIKTVSNEELINDNYLDLLSKEPEYWIITLCNNKYKELSKEYCKNSLKKYVNEDDEGKHSAFSVKNVFGNKYKDLKKLENIRFCFYQGEDVGKDKVGELDFDCVINENNFIDKDEIFGN